MSKNLDQYVARVRGTYIDVDLVFGAQCWDQWSHYAANFLGVPSWPTYTNAGGTHPHAGYACNVHHNARAAGLSKWFEILGPGATPRAGDVAFWEFGSVWFPLSHVATVLGTSHGGRMLRCLTQNPGAVQVSDLAKGGLIGYLRPKALIASGAVTPPRTPPKKKSEKQEAFMSKYIGSVIGTDKKIPANKRSYVIYDPRSGFYTTWSGVDQAYTNDMARQYNTGAFNWITNKHWAQQKRTLDKLQARK